MKTNVFFKSETTNVNISSWYLTLIVLKGQNLIVTTSLSPHEQWLELMLTKVPYFGEVDLVLLCYLCTTSPLYYQCETEAARKVRVDKWHMGWFLSLWSSLLRDCAGLRLAWQGQCPWPYGSSTLFGNEDGPEQNLKEWAWGSSPPSMLFLQNAHLYVYPSHLDPFPLSPKWRTHAIVSTLLDDTLYSNNPFSMFNN